VRDRRLAPQPIARCSPPRPATGSRRRQPGRCAAVPSRSARARGPTTTTPRSAAASLRRTLSSSAAGGRGAGCTVRRKGASPRPSSASPSRPGGTGASGTGASGSRKGTSRCTGPEGRPVAVESAREATARRWRNAAELASGTGDSPTSGRSGRRGSPAALSAGRRIRAAPRAGPR
jgi:hypothetical protein